MNNKILRQSAIALAVSSTFSGAFAADPSIQSETIEIIGSTPVRGVGIPKSQIPSNVQSVSSSAMEATESQNLPEFMSRQLPSVTVNEIQGNPYQPDVNYRGFTASPLLGTPQGLSVYVDGVRANEPFGDTVNWDLIPHSAIASMDLIPGSNPLFGLNTLGGALSVHTKDGFSHPGGQVELSTGSFQRRNAEFSYGGHKGSLGWFVSGDWFKEDGWRDYSNSEVKQFFGKLSHRSATGEADLSLLRARSDLIGNGLLPESMYKQRRNQIFTRPDATSNDLTQVTLTGKLFLSDATSLSGSLYHRQNKNRTLNGDANDGYEGDYETWADPLGNNGAGPAPTETGAYNRTSTDQKSTGGSLQWNLQNERHLLSLGISHDQAKVKFRQTTQEGVIDATRGVSDLEDTDSNDPSNDDNNHLTGRTKTSSLFISETYTLSPQVHLTASARYNYSTVVNNDTLRPNQAANLDADYTYRKLNPAIGLTWKVLPALTTYAGFNQGNRVPTPIELGCADPANPCTLPNSMAADPYLKQVIARTVEAGLRGKLAGDINWNAGVFRTLSTDDILFVGTSTSAGYFTNFGKTRRQGLELGMNGKFSRFGWLVNYSYLQAQFKSDACLLAENNSTRGTDAACPADDEIRVKSGDRLPGLPEHSLKIGLSWRATDWLRIGSDIQSFSSRYVRGNENNQHQSGTVNGRTFEGAGKLPGYAILNLNLDADLGRGWQLFGKVNNVFDKRYETAGALAENPFAANGTFQSNPDDWRRETFVAPGAPRAAWVGIRYSFREF